MAPKKKQEFLEVEIVTNTAGQIEENIKDVIDVITKTKIPLYGKKKVKSPISKERRAEILKSARETRNKNLEERRRANEQILIDKVKESVETMADNEVSVSEDEEIVYVKRPKTVKKKAPKKQRIVYIDETSSDEEKVQVKKEVRQTGPRLIPKRTVY